MRICKKCDIQKELIEFSIETNRCNYCIKLYKQQWALKNKDKIKEQRRLKRLENLEEVRAKQRASYRKNKKSYIDRAYKWLNENRDYRNLINKEYVKNKRKNNKIYNISCKIRHRTKELLRKKNFKKNQSFKEYIGCTVEEFALHIEKQFKQGMTWELLQCGKIHLDHIIPLSFAKTEEEVYKLSHYTNIQPLWAVDNMKKGNRIYE